MPATPLANPDISTGTPQLSPGLQAEASCPTTLLPQHFMPPALVRAQVCMAPAATPVMFVRGGTEEGLKATTPAPSPGRLPAGWAVAVEARSKLTTTTSAANNEKWVPICFDMVHLALWRAHPAAAEACRMLRNRSLDVRPRPLAVAASWHESSSSYRATIKKVSKRRQALASSPGISLPLTRPRSCLQHQPQGGAVHM